MINPFYSIMFYYPVYTLIATVRTFIVKSLITILRILCFVGQCVFRIYIYLLANLCDTPVIHIILNQVSSSFKYNYMQNFFSSAHCLSNLVYKTRYPVHKIRYPVYKTSYPVYKSRYPVYKTRYPAYKTRCPWYKTRYPSSRIVLFP